MDMMSEYIYNSKDKNSFNGNRPDLGGIPFEDEGGSLLEEREVLKFGSFENQRKHFGDYGKCENEYSGFEETSYILEDAINDENEMEDDDANYQFDDVDCDLSANIRYGEFEEQRRHVLDLDSCEKSIKTGVSKQFEVGNRLRNLLTMEDIAKCGLEYHDRREKNKQEGYTNRKRPEEITAYEVKKYMQENFNFLQYQDMLYLFLKNYYRQISKKEFKQLACNVLDDQIKKEMKTVAVLEQAYQWLMVDETMCISPDEVEKSEFKIAFNNVTYDIESGEVMEHSQNNILFCAVRANYISDPYPETPLMDRVLLEMSNGDEAIIPLFYEVLGAIMTQSIKFKKMYVFAGQPNGGKSLLASVIMDLFPDELVDTRTAHSLGGTFSIASWYAKKLNVSMDLDRTVLSSAATSIIKMVTGDEKVTCEAKYKDGKSFRHYIKLLFGTNHSITLQHADDAFYDRIIVIPCLYSVPPHLRDVHLKEKLMTEIDGIVTRAAHAAHRLVQNNFVFTECFDGVRMREEWRNGKTDPFKVGAFIKDNCRYTPDSFIPTSELYEEYLQYREEGNQQAVLQKNFPGEISRLTGYQSVRKKIGSGSDESRPRGFQFEWKKNNCMYEEERNE